MLRWDLGDTDFFQGIKDYLNDPDLAYGFATTQNLKDHLEATSGKDLTGFFEDWLYGEGFPTYSLVCKTREDEKLSVIINQTQSHPSVDFFEMPVPVRFYGSENDTTIVFNSQFSGQEFLVELGFVPDSLAIDPELWLVSGENSYTLGMNENDAMTFKILPNPATDFVFVEFKIPHSFSSYQITDLQGTMLLSGQMEAGSDICTIDVSTLQRGVYLFTFSSANQRATVKVVIS